LSRGIAMWKPGDRCALRGVHNSRVLYAQSVIVVRDSPSEVALLLLPGAQWMVPAAWNLGSHGNGATSERWSSIRRGNWKMEEHTWHTNRFLILLERGKYYATIYIWQHQPGTFSCYYINFQLPFRRSRCGFDTLDLELDIVIDPAHDWRWKDLDDYQEAVSEGGIGREWRQGIEQDQAEVFERLEKRLYPLDGSWLGWRPDFGWTAPALPSGWQEP
jgi:hypothetical protein